ncbi:MAG: aldo/keto reductase [Planctomycetota bacterium]|jgi:predicted aldo/keto reductase-like oxidoreductase
MKEKHNNINRRDFLKTIGAAGLGSVVASAGAATGSNDANATREVQKPEFPQMPKRKLGKTGVEVPSLSLGTNRLDNQIILRNALKWGVNYWDTANSYVGGNSELNIGKYLSKSPEVRKEIFIVSKASRAETPEEIEKRLQISLKRMNTKYIDLYYGVHGLDEPGQLTDELKQWVKDAKKRKLIRFFGFSTHENMARNLAAAAKLDWIDAIMTSYNFRLMQDDKIQAGIEACYKAGIGIIAMKVLGIRLDHKVETEEDKKLVGQFLQRGFTEMQAKIKVVLEDERISSACVGTNNVGHLTSNVAAALNKTKLTQVDRAAFKEYAKATCSSYCAGCAYICGAALPDVPYVSDIMRYLMYYNGYGEQEEARKLFAHIPSKVTSNLLNMDYSLAEARCPQHLPIGKLIAEAVNKLA